LTAQYAATGTYTDGSVMTVADVGWTSTATSVATIDPSSGLATSVAYGTTTIKATSGSVTGSLDTKVIASFRYGPAGTSVYSILSAECSTNCHSATGSLLPAPGNVTLSGNYWSIFDSTTSDAPFSATQESIVSGVYPTNPPNNPLVVAGKPESSPFYISLCVSPPSVPAMPITASPPLPGFDTTTQCPIIAQWIDDGALDD
jgi:hypothetical protein